MKLTRLTELLNRFAGLRVAVVGDLFLDQWFHIDPALDEPSVETELTAWQVVRHRAAAGAAGTVINNLRTLGVGKVYAVGFTGEDGDGWMLTHLLQKQGVDTAHVITVPERMTPSYMKPMFMEGDRLREGNRLDVKNHEMTPAWAQERIIASLNALAGEVDAIIALDQLTLADTGAVSARVREALAALGQKHEKLTIYADSREFIGLFRHVIIKCNNLEAARALGETLPIPEMMRRLTARTGRPVVVTLGSEGIAVGEGTVVPAAVQKGPIDVCGAGDSASAALVSGLCAGASMAEAAFLGNLSAGVTVRKLGTTGTASPAEMVALYHEQFEVQA